MYYCVVVITEGACLYFAADLFPCKYFLGVVYEQYECMTPYTNLVQNKNIAVFSPILLSMHEQLLKIIISFDRPFLNIIIYMLNFSRASKAFPNQQSLKDSGCAPCFTEVN